MRPQQCTFVPDSAEQSTSDHGWRLPADAERLRPVIAAAHALGVRVSVFMDPDPGAMAPLRALGADRVELYTERYAKAHGSAQSAGGAGRVRRQRRSRPACRASASTPDTISNRANLADFLRAVPGVLEVSIGHALIADALELGLAETVRAYRRCIHLAATAAAP